MTSKSRGFSLLEVLIAVAIFLVGIVAIAYTFPRTLQSAREAELATRAAMLAQMKAEEIRRDDDRLRTLVRAIASRTSPTPPIVWPRYPDLAYSFSGVTIKYSANSGDTPVSPPLADPGVARVIILRAHGGAVPSYPNIQYKDVLYELPFGP